MKAIQEHGMTVDKANEISRLGIELVEKMKQEGYSPGEVMALGATLYGLALGSSSKFDGDVDGAVQDIASFLRALLHSKSGAVH